MTMANAKISDWPSNYIKIIHRNIPNAKNTVLLGQSLNSTYHASLPLPDSIRLIISYNSIYQFFVAWNADIHRYIHVSASNHIEINARWINHKRIIPQSNEIKPVYISRMQKTDVDYPTSGYEKVLLIGQTALLQFCRHYEEYIYPNDDDQTDDGTLLWAAENIPLKTIHLNDAMQSSPEHVRIRDNITRARRDSTFRKRVLDYDNAQCIICGTKEKHILQAAHLYSVQFGGDDSTDNGCCMCANHHLLYDNGLLDIDWENNTFSCSSKVEKEMSWYLDAEKRDFSIFR